MSDPYQAAVCRPYQRRVVALHSEKNVLFLCQSDDSVESRLVDLQQRLQPNPGRRNAVVHATGGESPTASGW